MSGDDLYAWQVQELDGNWSMVGVMIPEMGTHTPLIARSKEAMLKMSHYATDHASATGQRLRFVKFTLAHEFPLSGVLSESE